MKLSWGNTVRHYCHGPPVPVYKRPDATPASVYNVWKETPQNIYAKLKDVDEFVTRMGGTCLDAVDGFSGRGMIREVYTDHGLNAMGFDAFEGNIYREEDDIITHDGFWQIVKYLSLLTRYGLAILGPPCGLWVFLTSSLHRRSEGHPWGNYQRRAAPPSEKNMI